MESLKIVLMSVVAAVLYGVTHDQVTARLCVEYFTIGHPQLFATESPTLLALGWGLVATWWFGLLLGLPLAGAARLGSRPKTKAATLRKPLGLLILRVGGYALLAGIAGYIAAKRGWIRLLDPIADRLDPDREVLFLAAAWAHVAAYVTSALEGLGFCIRTWRKRGRPRADVRTS